MATKEDLPESVQVIKNFCALLSPYSVKQVSASYDGSGDSGSLDITVQHNTSKPQRGARVVDDTSTASANLAWTRLESFVTRPEVREDKLITQEKVDEFHDAFFELLPGGWEIDSGSYGEINVDIETLEVYVEHNERIEDVHTTTARY